MEKKDKTNSCCAVNESYNGGNNRMKGKRIYNAIKAMAVVAAENPDSASATDNGNKKKKPLWQVLEGSTYVTMRVEGNKFGNVENPYLVLNITPEALSGFFGKFLKTPFVYHVPQADGTLHSEYWAKRYENEPYHITNNPYVKKDESDEWLDQSGENNCYTIVGKDFKYSIPFPTLDEVNETINDNLNRFVERRKQVSGHDESKEELLNFSMYATGLSGYFYRKAINRGLI